MKIGVLICGYDCENEIAKVLQPWLEARSTKLGGHEYVLSMVHGEFKEYADAKNTVVSAWPHWPWISSLGKELDYLVQPQPADEATMRNYALNPLLTANCDYIWLLDADEYYTVAQIEAILTFMAVCKWETWFKVSLKNYAFSTSTYLADPFQPPRIFRNKTNGYQIKEFYFDNDITYRGTIVEGNAFVNKEVSYKELPSKVIPKNIAWVRHESWLNNGRSLGKINYQTKHFAHGAGCSFAWDNNQGGLIWNKEYFRKTNQTIPVLQHD